MAFEVHEKKALGLITSLYLVRMLGLFMVLPIMSIYGMELKGASPFLLGIALGIYGLTQALFQIPFGWASDRFGRKPMLVIGFSIFVLGSLICALSSSIELLLLGRAIQGGGAVSAVLLALLADSTRNENRTLSMAVIGISIGLSFGLSVVLGPAVASLYKLQGVFVFTCVLGLVALALAIWKIDEPHARERPESFDIRMAVSNFDLLRLDLSIFALHFLQMCIWVAVPGVLISKLGINLDSHWLVYLIAVGGGFLLMAPFMRLWDKQGKTHRSLTAGIVALLIAVLSMSQVEQYHFFLLGLVLFFWGFNLLEATLPSALTKIADPKYKGSASGVYSTCQFAGVFFGGVVGGWLLANFGPIQVFQFSAAICVLWLGFMSFRKVLVA